MEELSEGARSQKLMSFRCWLTAHLLPSYIRTENIDSWNLIGRYLRISGIITTSFSIKICSLMINVKLGLWENTYRFNLRVYLREHE